MSVDEMTGFDSLSDNDKAELRKFETWLRSMAAAKNGAAMDAPELLNVVIYGEPNAEPTRVK